jgi:hypothetical protein
VGADIYGWIETREAGSEWWDSAIRIHDIVYRYYAMFASLLGVRNGDPENVTADGRCRAIAPGRGAPLHPSQYYALESHGAGQTWALWSEFAAIDWEEEGKRYTAERPYPVDGLTGWAGDASDGETISMVIG